MKLGEAIRSDIRIEVEFLQRRNLPRVAWLILFGKGLHVLYVYRIFRALYEFLSRRTWLWKVAWPLFGLAYRLVTFFVYNFKGIEIPYQVEIGYGLRLVHPHSIVLTPQTKIGDNCTIFHGVTCGVNHLDRSGYPRIGNQVVLYPGVKVIGNVEIGNIVIIGSNSVVTKDIPSNSVAVGAPAERKRDLDSLDELVFSENT